MFTRGSFQRLRACRLKLSTRREADRHALAVFPTRFLKDLPTMPSQPARHRRRRFGKQRGCNVLHNHARARSLLQVLPRVHTLAPSDRSPNAGWVVQHNRPNEI